jgi:hypothetical protein
MSPPQDKLLLPALMKMLALLQTLVNSGDECFRCQAPPEHVIVCYALLTLQWLRYYGPFQVQIC